MTTPVFVRGENDLLFDAQGTRFVDLHCGFGSVFMGHCHPGIVEALASQTKRLWTGGFCSEPYRKASSALESALVGYTTAGIYSTGMESGEFALRATRLATGKSGWIGFDGSMHGKSIATAALGWGSDHGDPPTDCVRLPFPSLGTEDEVLAQLQETLAARRIGAVLIEPVLGSSGGMSASARFHRKAQSLAREHGAWLVVDEILTGFHRLGKRFCFQALGLEPDVVLVGKACGNGFPVSAVMLAQGHAVDPRMLPGSTFAGNPLAAAALRATLEYLIGNDIESRIQSIAAVVRQRLGWLDDSPYVLRGNGALWIIDGNGEPQMADLHDRLLQRGVNVSTSGRQIRLLPPSTIDLSNLDMGCKAVASVLRDRVAGR